ncbi:unnamed protein product [Orchesella dallaii]|uniref:Phosphatidic acid phosphatase type 2/haloperoxidase domain-containing protein n=1 Tax=Orchesella dallaii TaxID=48710 RepID=A0ABP1RW12_9HEXA
MIRIITMVVKLMHYLLATIFLRFSSRFIWLHNDDYVATFQKYFGVMLRFVPENEEDDAQEENAANHDGRNLVEIRNKWALYLFRFGTALGGEMAFILFFTFLYWNVDEAVGRHVVLVWGICMYFGQALKDMIRWPRPTSPPVAKLDDNWVLEFGMPSTHAIVGSAVPAAVIYFTDSIYQNYFGIGVLIGVAICTLVCLSRLYLGMHSILDILGGLLIFTSFFPVATFLINQYESEFFACEWGWLVALFVGIELCLGYPSQDHWNPTRADTFGVVGCFIGLLVADWLNHQESSPSLNELVFLEETCREQCVWRSISDIILLAVIRQAVGIAVLLLTKKIAKKVGRVVASYLAMIVPMCMINESGNGRVTPGVGTELFTMFYTYAMVSFIAGYATPLLFEELGIGKDTSILNIVLPYFY